MNIKLQSHADSKLLMEGVKVLIDYFRLGVLYFEYKY